MDQWKKELFFKLPNYTFSEDYIQIFAEDILDENELITLSIISSEQYSLLGIPHISINYILELLGKYPNDSNKRIIKEAVINLVKKDYIAIFSDAQCKVPLDEIKHSKYFYVKVKERMYVQKNFTKVYFDELRKILALNNKSILKIFTVYLHVIKPIYEGTGNRVSFVGIETLVDATGYDRKSVMKYLDILCENEILCGVTIHSAKKSRNYFTRKRFEEYLSLFIKDNYEEANEYVTGIEWKGYKSAS